ncbi:hypothetical protein GX48_00085 [Paracoccidioides brasiliensis]|nr:hypothetical protein GX48_00085 [Paracoccidioides brasiliensis]
MQGRNGANQAIRRGLGPGGGQDRARMGARIGDRAGSYVHILIWGVTRQQFNSLLLPLAPSPSRSLFDWRWRWRTPTTRNNGLVPLAPLEHSCSRACSAGTTEQRLQWEQANGAPVPGPGPGPGDWIKVEPTRHAATLGVEPSRALPRGFSVPSANCLPDPSPGDSVFTFLRHLHLPVHFLLLILGACPSGAKEAESQKSQTSTGSNFARNNPFPPVWTPFHQAASSDWAQILQMALIPRVPAADSLTGSMKQSLSGTWP